ncbi:hypothetical protein T03_8012, partial [Trichinella britovi]
LDRSTWRAEEGNGKEKHPRGQERKKQESQREARGLL